MAERRQWNYHHSHCHTTGQPTRITKFKPHGQAHSTHKTPQICNHSLSAKITHNRPNNRHSKYPITNAHCQTHGQHRIPHKHISKGQYRVGEHFPVPASGVPREYWPGNHRPRVGGTAFGAVVAVLGVGVGVDRRVRGRPEC
jgi:hypothetical protein